MTIQLNGRLDSRKALKNKDPLRDDVIIVFVFSEDDVMAGYRNFTEIGRWISYKY